MKFRKRYFLPGLLLLGIILWFLFPGKGFRDPVSTVLFDRNGVLMGARIAADGQWRFPSSADVPSRFSKAIISYEDKYFMFHPGVNPFSLVRALFQNIAAGHIVSGGSTLSMQVIRLQRKGKPRTLAEKFIEMGLALRLEAWNSKSDILALYASHAPFGGNVVGLDAASWRYFGRIPEELSWGEAAALAVLPNAPSLVFPGRNQELFLEKRNRLLDRLCQQGELDSMTCSLAKLETLPGAPRPLPQLAPHALQHISASSGQQAVRSSLDANLQEQALTILEEHHRRLSSNNIYNAAALILEVETGQVLVYIGNTENPSASEHGDDVDVIMSARSTGSILKPVLFAGMIDEGLILPGTLIPDIPTQIAGYSPKNFSPRYDGAVPAWRALARSLNVPAVRMLQEYGVEKFQHLCQQLGLTTLVYPPDHYGLSLILGGGEAELWELCGLYAGMARVLDHFNREACYLRGDLFPPRLVPADSSSAREKLPGPEVFSAAAIWQTFEALRLVNRPESETGWDFFSSTRRIAWKTGTSFGYRDAWAIGTTPGYVVGVWAGNADGEGRPGLTGISAAAPILFELFNLLPPTGWFEAPYEELYPAVVCRQSGHLAGRFCEPTDTQWVTKGGLESAPCPYHILVHLDASGRFRVTSRCESVSSMIHRNWFVLPPVQEWFYRFRNPSYQPLPPFREGCHESEATLPLGIIYPREGSRLVIPRELSGEEGKMIAEATHRDPDEKIYWHLDHVYLGMTREVHQMGMSPGPGPHTITLVDGAGNTCVVRFTVAAE